MQLMRLKRLRPEEQPPDADRTSLPYLDEIVFTNATVHVERMDEDHFWMGISENRDAATPADQRTMWMFDFTVEDGKIRFTGYLDAADNDGETPPDYEGYPAGHPPDYIEPEDNSATTPGDSPPNES